LHPAHGQFAAQAIVDVVGDGQCVLTDCVATLEEPQGVRLALASLSDANGLMRMDPQGVRSAAPRLELNRCFIRGEGNLAAMRVGRPLDLRVDNSLVALAGSFLNLDGSPRDAISTAAVDVRMSHLTTYVTENLLRLVGKDLKASAPVNFKPENCLFASGGKKALVHLEGVEGSETQVRSQLTWEGRHNAYSRFSPLLDQKPRGDDMPMMPFYADKWKTFTGEADPLFTSIDFATLPAGDASLTRVVPGNFKVAGETNVPGYGAAIDALPTPVLDAQK
jgi:hypothetical protein